MSQIVLSGAMRVAVNQRVAAGGVQSGLCGLGIDIGIERGLLLVATICGQRTTDSLIH